MKKRIVTSFNKIVVFMITLFCLSCQNTAEAVEDENLYEEVSYQSEGVNISGGLWLPKGNGPHPAMVIVHGSGPATKFAATNMANHFMKLGFAVLSHDKRGVGKSGGVFVERLNASEENLTLLAKDVTAGINYLKTRPDIDKSQIGLYGWSQAGWIVPIAASMNDDLKFSILISGPTVTVGEENYYSELTGNGSIDSGLSQEEMSKRLREKGPYWFDPVPLLKQMNFPALWLLGANDKSIPIPETVKILDTLIEENNRKFTYKVFENAGHGLRINGSLVKDYWQIQDEFIGIHVKTQTP